MNAERILLVRRRHPDDRSFFDAFEVQRIEHYKTSSLSGDQWRFRWIVRLYRKGVAYVERIVGGHDGAFAATVAAEGLAIGSEVFGASGWTTLLEVPSEEGTCCQPCCAKPATVRYAMRLEYDQTCFFSRAVPDDCVYYREFCEDHRERGDAGLDDGGTNYIEIPNESADETAAPTEIVH